MNKRNPAVATALYYQTISLTMNGYNYKLHRIRRGEHQITVFRYGAQVCELVATSNAGCISQAFQQLFVLAKGA